jgi:predicted nuclease of predicted toxin-antitoxin system
MKIAIMFFGQLRWFDSFNEDFKKYILPKLNGHSVTYFSHFGGTDQTYLQNFKELYNPLNILFEEDSSIEEIKEYFNSKTSKISRNLVLQIYSLHKCFSLVEAQSYNFDLFIKIRTDLKIKSEIDLNVDDQSVYICRNKNNISSNIYSTDLVLLTKNFNIMKKICNMGFDFDEIILRLSNIENRNLFYHEEILANYLNFNGINIKTHNMKIGLARNND